MLDVRGSLSKGRDMNHHTAVLVGLGNYHQGVPELDWGAREARAEVLAYQE